MSDISLFFLLSLILQDQHHSRCSIFLQPFFSSFPFSQHQCSSFPYSFFCDFENFLYPTNRCARVASELCFAKIFSHLLGEMLSRTKSPYSPLILSRFVVVFEEKKTF
eukprot:Pompholyxophrys_punicea_v1_NODE_410_length_2029_cov_5.220365.p3 type:complete len:108 gc:universal NODE_410_length_2029_cov_5.220365:302-625(+)